MDYKEKVIALLNSQELSKEQKEKLEAVFPELKESEDERIMKELLDFCKNRAENYPNDPKYKNISAWIAWLEKQGETFTKKDVDDAYLKGVCDAKHELEKQGEQKPNDKIQIGKKYKCIASPRYSTFVKDLIYRPEDKFLCSLMNFCSDCFEQIEDDWQKPADKVEPKFKVGDWVIGRTTSNEPRQIAEITEEGYKTTYGGWIGFSFENDVRLWTIQDAQDGDVLACESGWTCIFKTLVNDKTFSSYCFMDDTKWFYKTGSECHTLKEEFAKIYNGKIHPATREQRDLLFQKMEEAGYVWDADNKVLKKSEQKPAF